jgi:hypothetical protein
MNAVQIIIHDRPDRVAISAPIEHNYQWDHPDEIETLRARVNGRCQDLLAIVDSHCKDDQQDRICRIEFLHRSVRDFLNEAESVQSRLENHAGVTVFDTNFTLFASYVFLIKRASKLVDYGSVINLHRSEDRAYHEVLRDMPVSWLHRHKDEAHHQFLRDMATSWCTEAFIHLQDIPPRPSTLSLVYALDNGMQLLHTDLGLYHWSNHLVENPKSYQKPPRLHDLDVTERGGRDLLGHLIELGLTSHVEFLLRVSPTSLQSKKGRPYLDYALRYKANVPFRRDRPKEAMPDCAMIQLLLGQGCDVNEVVQIHGNRTLWDSYLYFIYAYPALRTNIECHRKAVWLLIGGGAKHIEGRVKPNVRDKLCEAHDSVRELETASVTLIPMQTMLAELFGAGEAEAMQQQVSKGNQAWGWQAALSWLRPQRQVVGKTTQFEFELERSLLSYFRP